MANKFLSGINVTGTTTLNTVANAGTDTDKFLVLDASGNVDFRTGAELYADLGIGSLPSGFTSTLKHAVKAGVALTKGQAVYVTSADGTNMIVGKASNASEATSSKTLGLIETALSINGIGNVITEGLLAGLDTTGATNAGDPVWLGTDGNLIYGLLNKPYAPAHLVFIGVVTRINANNGEIFVKVQNGFELKEIHDVDLITTTPINGHILGYNGTLWVNKTIAGWLGFTPADDSLVVKLAGTQTITGAKTFSLAISGHEGIAFLNGVMPPITSSYYSGIGGNSNGISIVTRPVSTNYTNNLYFAASNNSFTFPNATGTIALTSDLTAYVPTSRTLTINGVAYDLSADRSWTIEAGGSSASTRTIQKFTSTSSQTTFTITGGYTVGMVDVWVNGVKLDNAVDFTASNGTTVVLTDALTASQIVEVYKYGSQFIVNNGLRQKTLFTATAGQTTFTVAYSVGLVDVYYNGSKLDDSEFTATNGTSIVLGTACAVNDKVEVISFSYNVNGFTGIGGSGTINNLPKFTAAGTIGDSAITDNGTTVTLVSRALAGTSAVFSSSATATAFIPSGSSIPTNGMYLPSANTLGFSTASSLDMVITSTGNVGIGINDPLSRLHISGQSGTTGLPALLLYGEAPSNGQRYGFNVSADQLDISALGTSASIGFYTGGNASSITRRLLISSTGAATFSSSVTAGASIGVSNSSTIANNNFYLLNSSTNKLWNIVNIGSGVSGRVGNFEINNNAIDIFAITQTGAVGIGITSPSRKLHVYGSTSGVFEGILVENGASNAYAIYQSKTGNSNLWQFGTWNDNSFRIGTSGVGDFLNITSAGRIGIGTDIPASNMQLGRVFGFIQDINSGYITANRGTNENYIVSQYAVRIHLDSAIGEINFDTAPSGTAGTYATLSNRLKIKDDGRTWIGGAISGLSGSGVLLQVNGQTRLGGTTILHNGSNVAQEVRLSCNGAASFFIDGALSKNSGSFRIDHPLESMTETHQLVHSFVEAPQADLYYRGKLNLVNGKGQANIDEVATMTEGTFEALCREVQCFTTNETGWDLVKGKVIGNIIYIESQNANSTDEISWLVIGERKDKHMMDTFWTDENGRVIVEPLKPIQEQDNNNK